MASEILILSDYNILTQTFIEKKLWIRLAALLKTKCNNYF